MDEIRKTAREIAVEAGQMLRSAWGGTVRIDHKGEVDLVTETDRAVEAFVVARLRAAFPDHVVIGEEEHAGKAPPRPPGDRYAWYVDPLDGTTNFAHSYPQFAVSIGLARAGEQVMGVVVDPVRDEVFEAATGAGATMNGSPIAVSATAPLDSALLGTGFPYDRREHIDYYLSFLRDVLMVAQGVRRVGSAALDLCHIACGRLDGFWEWKLSPWDTAAGAVIVREAGGRMSDFRGEPFDPHGSQTLASNGAIHDDLIRVLTNRLESSRG